MFSTLTAITGRRLTRPPVSGSTGLALAGLLVEGLGVGDSGPAVVAVGSGATPGSSRVAAKPIPADHQDRGGGRRDHCVRAPPHESAHGRRMKGLSGGRRYAAPPGRPWHILYFLPDPHGHGVFRPTPAKRSSAFAD